MATPGMDNKGARRTVAELKQRLTGSCSER